MDVDVLGVDDFDPHPFLFCSRWCFEICVVSASKAPPAQPQVGGSVHWSVPVPSSYASALHLGVWVNTAP